MVGKGHWQNSCHWQRHVDIGLAVAGDDCSGGYMVVPLRF